MTIWTSGSLRMEAHRALLADHAVPVKQRVPPAYGRDRTLVAETVAAVREVLTAIETDPAERVDAAAALAEPRGRSAPRPVPGRVQSRSVERAVPGRSPGSATRSTPGRCT